MPTIAIVARVGIEPLRVNKTSIATVAEGGTGLDLNDPAVRRDLNLTAGRWSILTAQVDNSAPVVENSAFTVGAEAANVINVQLQLGDSLALATTGVRGLHAWLSSSSTGSGIIATAPNGAITATAGAVVDAAGAKKSFTLISDSSGLIGIDIAESGNTAAFYLAVLFPDGQIKVSGAIDFA